MKSQNIPVLLWKNGNGLFTGMVAECDLSDGSLVAVAESKSETLQQLKACMEWTYRSSETLDPDFRQAELRSMTVAVRPRYYSAGREFPCAETLELPVPYVRGQRESGMHVCAVPHLGLIFQQLNDSVLHQTAFEGIQQRLSGLSPRELVSLLPIQEPTLDQIIIRIKDRSTAALRLREPDIVNLKSVAKAMGTAEFRKRFLPAWMREHEVVQLSSTLKQAGSVLLVGDRKVGKSTLLVAAIRHIERQSIDDESQEHAEQNSKPYRHRFWYSSAARLVAGMQFLGEWQQRCEQVIDDLREIRGVLYVESLTDLLTRGGSAPEDSIAAYLTSFLHAGDLKLIAEVTPMELETCRRLLPGFVDVFELYHVEPLAESAARQALQAVAELRTRDSRVTIETKSLDQIGRLHRRFYPYQPLPGRASEFVTTVFADAVQENAAQIELADVIGRFSRDTGLPVNLLRDDLPISIQSLRDELGNAVKGQPQAVDAVAGFIASFKAGLNDPGRPLATLLFAGPTGVGKTELARATARLLFGSGGGEERLLRFDMSEYSSFLSAQRLLNDTNGSSGRLISRVRQQPFQIVLFDEIEKASSDVFDLLLGLFDEGRLTDRYGRTANFCTSIVIMTSNLGARTQSVGFGDRKSVSAQNRPEQYFRPEFFNRIDSVVNFDSLSRETCRSIVRGELRKVSQREGIVKRELRLDYSSELVDHLLQVGFDPAFGARPLQRTIERLVVGPLSRHLLASAVRNAKVSLSLDGNQQLTFG